MTESKTPQAKVLLVEDDLLCSEMLQELLIPRGFEVHCAGTCAEGNRLLATHHYEWIIIDYDLPDGCGIDILQHPDFQETPTIAITGGNIRPPLRKALESGLIRQILLKPFELKKLFELLANP